MKDDDWIIVTFRFFPFGEGHIWAKLEKKFETDLTGNLISAVSTTQ